MRPIGDNIVSYPAFIFSAPERNAIDFTWWGNKGNYYDGLSSDHLWVMLIPDLSACDGFIVTESEATCTVFASSIDDAINKFTDKINMTLLNSAMKGKITELPKPSPLKEVRDMLCPITHNMDNEDFSYLVELDNKERVNISSHDVTIEESDKMFVYIPVCIKEYASYFLRYPNERYDVTITISKDAYHHFYIQQGLSEAEAGKVIGDIVDQVVPRMPVVTTADFSNIAKVKVAKEKS